MEYKFTRIYTLSDSRSCNTHTQTHLATPNNTRSLTKRGLITRSRLKTQPKTREGRASCSKKGISRAFRVSFVNAIKLNTLFVWIWQINRFLLLHLVIMVITHTLAALEQCNLASAFFKLTRATSSEMQFEYFSEFMRMPTVFLHKKLFKVGGALNYIPNKI